MNGSIDTLEDEVEPFLLRMEMLVRTPRGRIVTQRAYHHLGMKPAGGGTQRGLF